MSEQCVICGRERGLGVSAHTGGTCRSGSVTADPTKLMLIELDCLRRALSREKARADDEYERAEMFQRDARRSDAALVAERARAEKAEAALEAENLGAKAEQGRLADALVAEKARAEKAEADEAIAWSEVHDHEAVIRNFEKSVAKLQAALAAARRECEAEKERADQAESERDAASEALRDALAWEAETRGRLGLPQIDAPMWAQIARAALGGGCVLDENEQVKRLTAAMREADRLFEQVGGSTRHHVRDCLLPVLKKHGLRLIAALAAPAAGEEKPYPEPRCTCHARKTGKHAQACELWNTTGDM